MRAGHVALLGGAVCDPAPGPSHAGGPSMLAQCEHRGPHLFAAKALVPGMLPQGLIGTGAPIRHPRALRTYPSRSESIRVNLTTVQAIRVNPSQSLSVASRLHWIGLAPVTCIYSAPFKMYCRRQRPVKNLPTIVHVGKVYKFVAGHVFEHISLCYVQDNFDSR